MQPEDDAVDLPIDDRPRPKWVRRAEHLLRFEETRTLRRREGWMVRTTVPGRPAETLDLEVAAGSHFVTWRQWEGRYIVDERQITEPPTSADDAMTMVLSLCTRLSRSAQEENA